MLFAPGYADGRSPYGEWTVVRAYAPLAWIAEQDPRADLAVLTLQRPASAPGVGLADLAGGNVLGGSASPGQSVLLVGYGSGRNDLPIVCPGLVYLTRGYPSVECPGFVSGTSGGAWLADYRPASGSGVLVGAIGGLQGGGCSAAISYTSPISVTVRALLARADAGAMGDTLPSGYAEGC